MKLTVVALVLTAVFFGRGLCVEESLLKPNDRIVLLGGTLAERLQYHGWLEARIQQAKPGLQLTFRNLGWSGDEVNLMPRPLEFESLEETLSREKATVAWLFFGGNESFKGQAGKSSFRENLISFIGRLREAGVSRIVLFSPTAVEPKEAPFPNLSNRNEYLRHYSQVIREVAEDETLPFVDLYTPTYSRFFKNASPGKFTINTVHFSEEGNRMVSKLIAEGVGIRETGALSEELRELVIEKNRQVFYRWRPSNAEYIFGRRKEPYGVLSFPPEMKQLDEIILELDQRIHQAAASRVP